MCMNALLEMTLHTSSLPQRHDSTLWITVYRSKSTRHVKLPDCVMIAIVFPPLYLLTGYKCYDGKFVILLTASYKVPGIEVCLIPKKHVLIPEARIKDRSIMTSGARVFHT